MAVVVSSATVCVPGTRVDRCVIDRPNIHVDRTQILVGAATGTRVAQVVNDHVDGVGIVAGGARRAVQVSDIACRIQERVQAGQCAGQSQRARARSADRYTATAGGTQVAAGRSGQGHGQVAPAVIRVAQVDG